MNLKLFRILIGIKKFISVITSTLKINANENKILYILVKRKKPISFTIFGNKYIYFYIEYKMKLLLYGK